MQHTSAARRVAIVWLPPCAFSNVRIPCEECNRHFRKQACFANHKHSTSNKKSIYERKRCCATCGVLMRSNNNECSKRYCDTCRLNREVWHLCYMRYLKDVFRLMQMRYYTYFMILRQLKLWGMCPTSSVSNSLMRVVRSWKATDIERCGKRMHSFWDEPVGIC
jgi:hypothetical protein